MEELRELKEYIAFDLEFNTVDGQTDIIQVSAVKLVDNNEVASFDSLVYTDKPLLGFINGLTGITKEMVETAPKLQDVLAKFNAFVGEVPLIGYNAIESDLPLLTEAGLDLSEKYALDVFYTVKSLRSTDLHGIKNLQLTTVAEYFGVKGHGHNSLEDARMTALVYEALLENEANKKLALAQEETHATNGLFDGVDLSAFFD